MCLIFGFVFVRGPHGGGKATWFLDERVFGTVRSVPVQGGSVAVRSC